MWIYIIVLNWAVNTIKINFYYGVVYFEEIKVYSPIIFPIIFKVNNFMKWKSHYLKYCIRSAKQV